MSSVDYNERIPNNVGLADDRTLQRALEHWQPRFRDWWREMGPEGAAGFDVYLRTAISVEQDGWAHFDYVKMPDYRWPTCAASSSRKAIPNRHRSSSSGTSA